MSDTGKRTREIIEEYWSKRTDTTETASVAQLAARLAAVEAERDALAGAAVAAGVEANETPDPQTRLRELVGQAAPEPWTVERDSYEGSYDYATPDDCDWPWRIKGVCDFAEEGASEDTARLIALAPEIARWAADAVEWVEFAREFATSNDVYGPDHSEGCGVDEDPCDACELLARLAALVAAPPPPQEPDDAAA